MHAPLPHHATLLAAMHRGEAFTPDQIEARLGVGERQARRIARALLKAHPEVVAVHVGKSVRYEIPPDARVVEDDPLHLSERERLALHVALQAAEASLRGTSLEAPLGAVRERVRQGSPVHFEHVGHAWNFAAPGEAEVSPEVFDALLDALRDERVVRLDYEHSDGTRSDDRAVAPYALACRNGSWLLLGVDAGPPRGKQVRAFSVPAVRAVRLTPTPSDRPEGFDAETHYRDAFGAFVDGRVETVRLRVDPGAAASFLRKRYHPNQMVEARHADGGLTVSFEVEGMPAVESFVRSFGPKVEVLEPASLRARMAEDARATAARYAAPAA